MNFSLHGFPKQQERWRSHRAVVLQTPFLQEKLRQRSSREPERQNRKSVAKLPHANHVRTGDAVTDNTQPYACPNRPGHSEPIPGTQLSIYCMSPCPPLESSLGVVAVSDPLLGSTCCHKVFLGLLLRCFCICIVTLPSLFLSLV